MAKRNRYDWDRIRQQITDMEEVVSYKQLSKVFGIPVSTLHDNIDLSQFRKARTFSKKTNDKGWVDITQDSDFPQSPEDLALAAGIDLGDYNIIKFDCFARQVFVKDVEKDLLFDEGKITGTIRDSGEMNVQTVWSSRLIIEPIKVSAKFIEIQRVEVELPEIGKTKNPPVFTDRALIIPDTHFGFNGRKTFHDPEILDAVLILARSIIPANVVILGDLLDFSEFTDRFIPQPNEMRQTQRALEAAAIFLGQLRHELPDTTITVLEGNHDLRIRTQVRKHLMALAGIHAVGEEREPVSLHYLLGLDKLKIDFVEGYPNNGIDLNGVAFIHGSIAASRPGATATKLLEKYGRSVIFGHIHRREYVETQVWSDKDGEYNPIFGYTPGCLCKIDGSVPGSTKGAGWGQGVGILRSLGDRANLVYDVPYSGKNKCFLI